jgi:glycine/D-amino acid oxidase-like deaminating enzyme
MIDFCIIGGGIAGVSAAFRLSQLGSTHLIEKEEALATHASGRSAALSERHYGNPAVLSLNRASFAYLKHEDGGVLSPRGLMILGKAGNESAFTEDARAMQMEPVSVADACARIPILDPKVITQAAIDPEAYDIDTDLLIQNFVRKARDAGAQFHTRSQATQITRTQCGWRIQTGEAAYEARYIVNAAGAWADHIAALAGIAPIGITPHRRSMARIAAPQGHDPKNWPMLFGPGETWYAKPDAGALIVSPADETPVHAHDAYAEDLTIAEGLDRYAQHVTAPITRPISTWAGLRSFAPDRQLVIGPSRQDHTFLWCAGQGGYGFQTAPAASQLLADMVSEHMPDGCDKDMFENSAMRF